MSLSPTRKHDKNGWALLMLGLTTSRGITESGAGPELGLSWAAAASSKRCSWRMGQDLGGAKRRGSG